MEITTHNDDDLAELHLRGFLDSTWADHLNSAIDQVIRAGSHRLILNLSEVTYLSSAGISVLLHAHEKLEAIHGLFGVCAPSPQVRQILKLTGLEQRLICDPETIRRAQTMTMSFASSPSGVRSESRDSVDFEIYSLPAGAPLECTIFGHPERLSNLEFAEERGHRLKFDNDMFGLGAGALGETFAECRDRCGEFLGIAGAVAQLPAREGSMPDYQVAREAFVPEVHALYGISGRGTFSSLIRFESNQPGGAVSLASLVGHLLNVTATPLAGIAFVAETIGLVGAALRRSPAIAGRESRIFQHPEIREWLSYSPQRVFPHSLTLIVGIVADTTACEIPDELAPFLRPLDGTKKLVGHLHAVAFPYRPIKKRTLDLGQTVAMLFESENPLGVLHLLRDGREISGAGDSEFVSGACWLAPIRKVTRGESQSSPQGK